MNLLHDRVGLFLTIAILFSWTMPVAAQTNVWTGSDDNAWTNALNWNGGVPGEDDDVRIPSTTTGPTMAAATYPATGEYGSFIVELNATVICLGDTSATNTASGGSESNPHGIGVTIRCQSAEIAGTLNADAQGFGSRAGPGGANGGGSHGGRGGGNLLPTYGQLREPTALGSGSDASSGGGAIRLHASASALVTGTLTANGGSGTDGGSGGSIWVQTPALSGNGVIRANGHARSGNPSKRGGGGGRIALDYDTSTFSGSVSAAGGGGSTLIYGLSDGQPGTLWEPQRFESITGTPENPALVIVEESFQYYFTNNTPRYWSLIVSNASFEVHHGHMEIHDLTLYKSTFNYDGHVDGRRRESDMDTMIVQGNVHLQDTSRLYLTAGNYEFDTLTIEPAAILLPMGDTNAVNGGTIENPYGSGVSIHCQTALIDGEVWGQNFGFPAAVGPGYYSSAGSHGGRGGNDTTGRTYGSLTQPTALGSSGLYADEGSAGAFALHAAGALTVNGLVRVDGWHTQNMGGGGSGGSLWLTAGTLAGDGTLTTAGDGRTSNPSHPGGGGGRIAIACGVNNFTGTITVEGGEGSTEQYGSKHGATGTVFTCISPVPAAWAPESGTVTLHTSIMVFGRTDEGPGGLHLNRTVDEWNEKTYRLRWQESLRDGAASPLSGEADYTVSGWMPETLYTVTANDEVLISEKSDEYGQFTFAIDIDATPKTIAVFAPPKGTLLLIR